MGVGWFSSARTLIKYVLRAIKWLSVAALLAATAALVTCGASDESYVKRLTGLEIKQGSIRLWKDTHGGFLGDGVTAAKIDYGMSPPKGWDELPLPGDLSALLYGDGDDQPFFSFGEGIPSVPDVQNGCYFFNDRADGGESDTPLTKRISFNFTVAIYDSDTGLIYLYSVDT